MSQMQSTRGQRAWPHTKATLLKRIASPDAQQAWQEFADLYAPIVFRYCRNRGLCDCDADEVVQNVFTNLVRAMQSFEYDSGRGRFRSWLCTVVARELQRFCGKRQHQRLGQANGMENDVAVQSNHAAAFHEACCDGILDAAMNRVRPQFDEDVWQAFSLTWNDHLPAPQIAEKLGKRLTWVYKARFRVQKALQAVVTQLADDIPVFNM